MTYYDYYETESAVYFVSDDARLPTAMLGGYESMLAAPIGSSSNIELALEIIDDPLDAAELKKTLQKIKNRTLGVSGIANDLTSGWVVKHPVHGNRDSLSNVIINLNDRYKWSRERIADWLDTLPDQPKLGGNNA